MGSNWLGSRTANSGGVAHLGEHIPCTDKVAGSIPVASTTKYFDMEYNLHNRREIPKDYECCWNCRYMSWMVGIGQGVRCTTEENNYRIFRTEEEGRPKLPVIPGVAEKCEHFESKWSKE